jgi:glycosyltransferase involved in cell wall biosynthesis
MERLLVFNCHEAWVHQLSGIGFGLDVIVGLKGRYTETWDERMRPLPAEARLVTLAEALASRVEYACVITHNITDLLDVRAIDRPKIIVLHSTLEGRVESEGASIEPAKARDALARFLALTGGHAVAVSELKGRSWRLEADIVEFGVDPGAYPEHRGELARGLRISNLVNRRRSILKLDFHDAAFRDVPITLVGHNPDIPGVAAASSWDELKAILSAHRFYVHTADPRLEDGYNMATLEAMAAGLPVLGNTHPSSPVEQGVSGFLSDDPARLREHALELLADAELASRMGARARATVIERFHVRLFRAGFARSIERAQATWMEKRRQPR